MKHICQSFFHQQRERDKGKESRKDTEEGRYLLLVHPTFPLTRNGLSSCILPLTSHLNPFLTSFSTNAFFLSLFFSFFHVPSDYLFFVLNRMDILDLEGQTAPESTRGLFDPPPPPPASAADVRVSPSYYHPLPPPLSLCDLPQALSQNEYDVSDAEQQRAKVLSGYPFNNSNRPSSFHPRSSLHTVNEEDSPEPFYKRQSSRRESLSLERKHRSSSVFNSLPIGTVSRRSSTGSRFPTMTGYPEVELDEEEEGLSREDALAMAEAKLTGAAYGVSTSIHRARRPNGDLYYGTTSDYGLGDEFIFKQQQQQQRQQQKPNRRLSEPGTRGYYYRYPDMDQLDHQRRSLNQQQQNRRTSVHWPYEDNNADYDLEGYLPRKTGNNSKAQSLTVDVTKSRRSSLRNDWRSCEFLCVLLCQQTICVINYFAFSHFVTCLVYNNTCCCP